MTSPVELLLARLTGVKQTGPSKWMARCPSHKDDTVSLGISEGDDGKVLLHCYARCETATIVADLKLTMSDLMPPREQGGNGSGMNIVAAYDYTDEEG
ncbi:MAG TPA: hypothetical protein VII83_05975, partial [Gaiellaceae bacterium]